MRELASTQLISRGSGPIVDLDRNPMDVESCNQICFEGVDGQKSTISDWLKSLTCDAFLVLRDGRIVNEQYFHGMTPDRDHVCYSMGKSLTATLLATMIGNELREDAAIEQYVPELGKTALAGAIPGSTRGETQ